ncbi:MAG: hypothetical protein AAB547_00575 [Patescibacteria group bacterium]
MNRFEWPSQEELKRTALEQLMIAGDEDLALQFEEKVLGGVRNVRISADIPREKIGEAKEELQRSVRERVLTLRQKCLDLGITQEEIVAADAEWEAKKGKKFGGI